RAAAGVRADRGTGRGVGGECEDRRPAGGGAEGLFIYTSSAPGFRGVLGGYFGAVAGSAARAGATGADSEKGSAPGGLFGECGGCGACGTPIGAPSPQFSGPHPLAPSPFRRGGTQPRVPVIRCVGRPASEP